MLFITHDGNCILCNVIYNMYNIKLLMYSGNSIVDIMTSGEEAVSVSNKAGY